MPICPRASRLPAHGRGLLGIHLINPAAFEPFAVPGALLTVASMALFTSIVFDPTRATAKETAGLIGLQPGVAGCEFGRFASNAAAIPFRPGGFFLPAFQVAPSFGPRSSTALGVSVLFSYIPENEL